MRRWRTQFTSVLLGCLVAAGASAQAPGAKLTIDAGAAGVPVSPHLYGVFFEDINDAADGGLYAEMVQNRSFEFRRGNEAWGLVKAGTDAKVTTVKVGGLNATNTKFLRLTATAAGASITNSGYEGMVFRTGMPYRFSVWLRSTDAAVTSATVTLNSDKGSVLATLEITGITGEWKLYSGSLAVSEPTTAGWLGVRANQAGSLDFDVVSLFPGTTYKDRPNGLRPDLATMVEGLAPRFVRFPGGCVIQGRTLAGAYRWKDTIGDVSARKSADNFWGYYQSFGLGFDEYFRFCEDLGADPLPVINAGMAFQDSHEVVPMSKLGPWVQDALDLVEYANGDANTTWGALRAKNGHPAPYNMKYLAIGNEQWGDEYFERYKVFAQALKAKYPEIQLVLSSGPLDSGPIVDAAWAHTKTLPVDIVDEHYYMSPEWFLANTKRYDTYDRKGARVFLGEYAAVTDTKRNNLWAALSEAAYMTGLERNGDVVAMASYAPLLAKEGATQWEPDMIRFNNETVFATPSYYVQQLFSHNLTKATLPLRVDVEATKVVDTSVSGGVGLGSWATQVEYKDLKVTDPQGKVIFQPKFDVLGDDWDAGNGDWNAKSGVLTQASDATECKVTYPADDWKGVTLSVKGRKKSGAEGMLILFGVQDGEYYWWNLGGWGNTQSAIEKGTAAGRTIVGKAAPITVDTNRWYDIRIELKGGFIRCYLNNKLVHEVQVPLPPGTFFAHAGRGADGSFIVKAVNLGADPRTVQIVLDHAPALEPTAQAQVLSGPDVNAENSFKAKDAVVPHTVTVTGVSADFPVTLEGNSVTVLRLKPQTKP
jgi:alpha-L-arabinofuranosidase